MGTKTMAEADAVTAGRNATLFAIINLQMELDSLIFSKSLDNSIYTLGVQIGSKSNNS